MVSRSAKKLLPRLKLRLGTKAVACAVLLIAVNTALVVGSAYWSLTSEFGERARRDIEVNLRTLALSFAETFSDAKVTLKDGMVTRVEIPRMPEFADHAIVDRAVSYVGGNATLFVYDASSLSLLWQNEIKGVVAAPVAMTDRAPMLMSIQNPERVLNILRSSTLTRRGVGMGRLVRRTGTASMVSGEMVVAVMPQLLRVGCRL